MLVAKLIQLGCLNPNAKVGICAMAGVNLGPFADYKSRFFGGSAAELFDFSNSQSRVSMDYASSLKIVLRHGVKVTYVGSMDDQLVSLEVGPHLLAATLTDFDAVFSLCQPDTPTHPESRVHRRPTARTRLCSPSRGFCT